MQLDFKDKVVVVTGCAKGIGKDIKETFEKEGAHVCGIDLLENDYFIGSISNNEDLINFTNKIIKDYGHVDYIINNAKPLFIGIDACSFEDFNESLAIGITGPFMLVKLLKDYLNPGASIINISSSRAYQSQAQSESYSAAKGGITSLTHSLAVSLKGIARVNSISPGWINTTDEVYKENDHHQHLVNRIGKPQDITNTVLFLCSDLSSFITGEDILVDGGMSKLMIYHNDEGWTFNK